jgi:TRAP-type mannitol/chloroaromatic compound transport system substrate-binding protein
MKRKVWSVLSILFALLLAVGGVIGCGAEEEPTTPTDGTTTPTTKPTVTPPPDAETWDLRMQCGGFPGEVAYDIFQLEFIDRIEKMSGGRVTIEPFQQDAVVGPSEVFDAVATGSIDFGSSTSAYHSGFMPSASVNYHLDWAFTDLEDYQFVHYYADIGDVGETSSLGWGVSSGGQGVEELYRQAIMALGVFEISTGPGVQYGAMPSTKPIRSAADVKGKKIRSYALTGKILEKLGASIVTISSSEMYTAFALGTIDASTWIGPHSCMERGLHEVCAYYIDPPSLPWCESGLVMNLDLFDSLPIDVQYAIIASGRMWGSSRAAMYPELDARAKRTWIENYDVEWIDLPEEEIAKFRAASVELWDEYAAADPISAKMIELYKNHMKTLGLL